MIFHYAGKYNGDESSLPYKEHHPNATPFKEPEDTKKLSLIANVGCILIMGILANYPAALAPGMGLNAFFAYTVVLSMGYSWQFALCAVFIEGIIFILMSVTNIREKILDCIPNVLKDSITAGIGLFIAFVGLANCGLVTNGATILQLGNLQDPLMLLTIFGLIVISILLAKNVKGAFLIGMLIVSAVGMAIGLVDVPNAVVSSVPSMQPVF